MNNQEKTNLYCPIDNIVDPSRIKTLKLCDRKIFTYDPYSFSMVFGFRGRNFGMIAFPLLVLLLWDIGLVFLMDYVPEVHTFLTSKHVVSFEDGGSLEDEIGLGLQDLITSLLTPVSFLMVFRLGRAAARYWDARAAMGKLIETSRTFISTSVVHIQSFQNSPRKQNLREEVSSTSKDISQDPKSTTPSLKKPSSEEDWIIYELARWTCLFPIAVKNFLRPDKNKIYKPKELLLQRRAEIGPLLNRTETKQLLDCLEDGKDKSYATIWILNNLRQLSHKASRLQHKEGTVSTIGSAVYRQLNEQIDTLTGAWGAMERINATPLPYVYVVHLRTFLFIYLFLWHGKIVESILFFLLLLF